MSTQPVLTGIADRYLATQGIPEMRSDSYAWEVYPLTGEIVGLAGASRRHNLVVANIVGELRAQLRGRPCEIYPGGMRVRVPAGAFVYPDVVIVNDDPRMDDGQSDALVNPTVLIEVLAASTERDDRGRKWEHYRQLASVRDYLLVAQDQHRIEWYTRQQDGLWLFGEESTPNSVVQIASIGCILALNEVYDKVA